MDEITTRSLARYLAGASTADEAVRVRSWLDRHPSVRARLEGGVPPAAGYEARRDPDAFLASMFDSQGVELEAVTEGASGKAFARTDRPPLDRSMRGRTRTTRTAIALLAVALLFLIGRDLFVGDDALAGYETGPGEHLEVRLPDGSAVHLNVASRLDVSSEFGSDLRTVSLEGEAYFDVTSDPRATFIVRTASADVVVHGTSFDVRAYEHDPEAAVFVSEGSVTVQSDTGEAILLPGQRAVLAVDGLRVDSADVEHTLAWREGLLSFRGTPMAEVARRMERWFGTGVVLADPSIDSMRLDGRFEDESAAETARAAAAALGLEVDVESGRIIFRRSED